MKELEELLSKLTDMKYDLFDNYRIDFKEKFEIVGRFMQEDLESVISAIDSAIDRMKEMDIEISELQDAVDELEESA